MTAGVDGSVDPEDAALDSLRDRRPGVFGDGVPVPSLVDQGVRGDESVGRMSRRLTPFLATRRMWRCAFVAGGRIARLASLYQYIPITQVSSLPCFEGV